LIIQNIPGTVKQQALMQRSCDDRVIGIVRIILLDRRYTNQINNFP